MSLPTPDFSAISELFTETWTLGTEWLIPLAVAIVAMVFITRDVEKWKILMLPMVVAERIIGMPVHFLIMAFAGIMFVVEAMSTQVVGNMMSAVKKYVGMDTDKIREKDLEKRQKVIEQYSKAYNQEKSFFGNSKKTKGMPSEILEEMRRRAGLQK